MSSMDCNTSSMRIEQGICNRPSCMERGLSSMVNRVFSISPRSDRCIDVPDLRLAFRWAIKHHKASRVDAR